MEKRGLNFICIPFLSTTREPVDNPLLLNRFVPWQAHTRHVVELTEEEEEERESFH